LGDFLLQNVGSHWQKGSIIAEIKHPFLRRILLLRRLVRK